MQLIEEGEGRLVDDRGRVQRGGKSALLAGGAEPRVPDLEHHCAARVALAPHLARHLVREVEQRRAQEVGVGRVLREGHLMAPRLRCPWLRDDWTVTAAKGGLLEPGRRLESCLERRRRRVLQVAHGGDTEVCEAPLRRRADAGKGAHRHLAQAAAHVRPGERREPAGLVELGGDLGEQLGGTDADRAGEAELVPHRALDPPGDLLGWAEEPAAAADVEEGLVDRDRLDQVGVAPEDLEHLALGLDVGRHVDGQVDRLGADALGARDRHRRAHAAGARLVGGGADDATVLGRCRRRRRASRGAPAGAPARPRRRRRPCR